MHNAKLAISAAFVLLLGCSSAQSSTVTFDFTGTVSSVDPNLSSAFAVGNPITGSYTFDTAAPNTVSGNPNVGIYNSSFAYTVSAGGFTSSGTGFGFNVFYNLFLASNAYRDQYRVALGSTGPSVNGLAYNGLSLDLFTTSTTPSSAPLASNALPSTPPAIDDFAMNLLTFYFIDPNNPTGVDYVFGSLNTLTVETSVTPLPPTWTMMLIGLAGFGFVTYRRKSTSALRLA